MDFLYCVNFHCSLQDSSSFFLPLCLLTHFSYFASFFPFFLLIRLPFLTSYFSSSNFLFFFLQLYGDLIGFIVVNLKQEELRDQWWLTGSDTRLLTCSPRSESGNLPSPGWTAHPKMVCHLGWYFAVGCALRSCRGEKKQKGFSPPKTTNKKKISGTYFPALTCRPCYFYVHKFSFSQ